MAKKDGKKREKKTSIWKKMKGKLVTKEDNLKRKNFSWYYIFLITLIFLISSLFFLIMNKFERAKINTNYMSSNIEKGSRVLYKETTDIQRFNVVILEKSDTKEALRVIGMPGDKVEMRDDILTINDSVYDEVYLKENYVNFKVEDNQLNHKYTSNFNVSTIGKEEQKDEYVPANNYILLGDNRQNSVDSREMGFYESSQIVGVARMKAWPLSDIGPVE